MLCRQGGERWVQRSAVPGRAGVFSVGHADVRACSLVDQVFGALMTRLNVASDRPDGSTVANRTAASLATATITPPGGPDSGRDDQSPLPAEPASTASTATSAATTFPAELIRSTWS